MSARFRIQRIPKTTDAFARLKFEDLHGFSAALGVASVLLIWGLWVWDWRIDPVHAPDVLGLHLLMGAMLAAYPIALLAGLSLRALPYLFYMTLLATQTLFLSALARLTDGLALGGAGLLFWFLVPPLMAGIFSWRVNLLGNLLLLALPNLLVALFGGYAGFDLVKFNLLAIPAAAIALCVSHFTDSLLRRIHELRKQVKWSTAAMHAAGEAMHVTDRNGVIEYVNPAFCASTGYAPEEAIGKKPSLLKSGFQDSAFYENLWATILKGEIWRGEIINRCKDGSSITLSMTISPVLDRDGRAERFIAVSHDISARKRLEEEVALGHAELEAIFNNAGGGIALLDLWGRFIKVNDFWLGILGYSPEEAAALSYKDIAHDDDVAETQQLFVALASGEIPHYESDRRFVRSGGRVFWGHLSMTPVKDEAGYIRAIIAIVQDINERKLLEDKLEAMAHYDVLTGLPNRALFFDRLSQAIAQTRRSQGQFALMFVDLDGFKAVNDTFGHDTGDALLKAVAEHLQECVRESDTVARMGGDEFTLILRAIRGARDAASVAEKILATLAAPYHLLGHECRIGASLGIVLYPQHGSNAEELLSQADNAMYAVKKAGKNAYRFAEEQKEA
ncbi:MAG: diguanylate cyclase [Sulfurimicrobium sp.]|nr:diguanylate cyclase [Sulfurimicrobium sp.]